MKLIKAFVGFSCFISVNLFGMEMTPNLKPTAPITLPAYYQDFPDGGMSMNQIMARIGNLGSTTAGTIGNPFMLLLPPPLVGIIAAFRVADHVKSCNVEFCPLKNARLQGQDLYRRCSRQQSVQATFGTDDSYVESLKTVLMDTNNGDMLNTQSFNTGRNGIMCHLFCNRFTVERDSVHNSRHLETLISNFSDNQLMAEDTDYVAIKRLAVFLSSAPGNNLANSVLHRYLRKINGQFKLYKQETDEGKQKALGKGISALHQKKGGNSHGFNVLRYLKVMSVLRSIHCKHLSEWRRGMSNLQVLSNLPKDLKDLLKEADCRPAQNTDARMGATQIVPPADVLPIIDENTWR